MQYVCSAIRYAVPNRSMQTSAISAESLGRMLETFLADNPHSVALENGELLFDFATAPYSVSGEGKCLLHIWSKES